MWMLILNAAAPEFWSGSIAYPLSFALCARTLTPGIDATRITAGDTTLQVNVHVFATLGIFFTQDLGFGHRLAIHCLVIRLEDRTLADRVAGRENDAFWKRGESLFRPFADSDDVNRD